MKTGRRIANPAAKQLAGTYRNDRHGSIVHLLSPSPDAPVRPAYLSPEAAVVWDEELRRVVASGATEADSSLFARYCECEASFRRCITLGDLPKAALLTELRRMCELLGIGGFRSRLSKVSLKGSEPEISPFSLRPE